jgi:hypothetical protein
MQGSNLKEKGERETEKKGKKENKNREALTS